MICKNMEKVNGKRRVPMAGQNEEMEMRRGRRGREENNIKTSAARKVKSTAES